MKTADGLFSLSFKYDDRVKSTVTTVIIKRDKEVVAEESVTKYHKDSPNKEATQKLAITKVLKNNFDKQERKQIWDCYLNRKLK